MSAELSEITASKKAPGSGLSTRFWPSRDEHLVHEMTLASAKALGVSDELSAELVNSARLTDALRAIEGSNSLGSSAVKKNLSRTLRRASALETCPESAQGLKLRAQLLAGSDAVSISEKLVELSETNIVAICGPLTTWLGKSRVLLHSALFSKSDNDLNKKIQIIDEAIPDVASHLRDVIDSRLEISAPPKILYSDLLYCGGEASFYPKHFAYFLPEDEGIKRAPVKKTVVFSNVYYRMYQSISKKFSDDIVVNACEGNEQRVREALALWFRGHDICHGVHLPDTDFKVMRCAGHWNSMVLQEAMADVFGFILMNTGPWKKHASHTNLEINASVYIREALRYLCRGNMDFPDAGAAMIQLSYLARHGFIKLDERKVKIYFEPQRLLEGLFELAQQFVDSALSNNEKGIHNLLDLYFHNGIVEFVDHCGVCEAVLDYVEAN